jgi:hypothetical protein
VGYIDIAANGLKVRGTAIEDGGTPVVRFGDDTPIEVGVYVRDLRVATDGSLCVFKGQDDFGRSLTRSGVMQKFGVVLGEEAIALSPANQVVYCDSNRTYVFNGVPRAIPLPEGTSQGIHSVRDDGTVVWTDERLRESTFGPFALIKWTTLGAWTFGVTQWGVVAWNAVERQAYAVKQDPSPLRTPRGAIVDGQLVIVVSLPEDVIEQRQFTPWVAPVDPPAPTPAPPAPAPVPAPEPEPTMPIDTTRLYAALQAERAKYPATLADDEHAATIMNDAVYAVRDEGWGLSAKPDGNRVWSREHNQYISYDAVHHKPTDTIHDAATDEWPAMRIVAPHQVAHHGRADRPWLAPVAPGGAAPVPVPTPTPTPVPVPPPAPPADLSPVLKRLAEIEGVLADLVESHQELEIALAHQAAKAPPVYEGDLNLGWLGTKRLTLLPKDQR